MNKNFILIALAFVALAAIGYAFQQKSQMDEVSAVCEKEKQELVKLAQEQQLQAKEFMKMAELAQHEAMIQKTLAEEQIKALKESK
jgi:Tfp pilus assembly protein PilO